MAVVQMKCPNCGGTMELVNNQFKCPNCRTMILNIVDAKINADVTIMSPEEFAQKLEESKRQFVVNINDNLQVFDVDTMVINKKIQDATQALESYNFDDVSSILAGVPDNILSAERLRFLAYFRATNEHRLLSYMGYIDTPDLEYKYSRYRTTRVKNHFHNIIKLADEQTRNTYLKLAQHCREQYDADQHMKEEISEVEKLLSVQLYQEAIAYTKEMCRKYPHTMLSWKYACDVKCRISNNYNCNLEYSMMQKCPDYSEYNLPEVLKTKITNFKSSIRHYETAFSEHTKVLGRMASLVWGTASMVILFYLSLWLFSSYEGIISELSAFVLLGSLIAFIVFVIVALRYSLQPHRASEAEYKAFEAYDALKNLVPSQIKEQYTIKRTNGAQKFFTFAIIVGIAIICTGVILVFIP